MNKQKPWSQKIIFNSLSGLLLRLLDLVSDLSPSVVYCSLLLLVSTQIQFDQHQPRGKKCLYLICMKRGETHIYVDIIQAVQIKKKRLWQLQAKPMTCVSLSHHASNDTRIIVDLIFATFAHLGRGNCSSSYYNKNRQTN